MMLIFNTKKKFQEAEKAICDALGYPDEKTLNYANERDAIIKGQTRYIMPKHHSVEVEADDEQEYNPDWEKHKRVE